MTINITNQPNGIIQTTDKPIINFFGSEYSDASHIVQSIVSEANMPDAGRLALFINDKAKCAELVKLLAVCRDTTDVRLAVFGQLAKNNKVPDYCKEKRFTKAIMQFIKFETTETAIYQALNNIS